MQQLPAAPAQAAAVAAPLAAAPAARPAPAPVPAAARVPVEEEDEAEEEEDEEEPVERPQVSLRNTFLFSVVFVSFPRLWVGEKREVDWNERGEFLHE